MRGHITLLACAALCSCSNGSAPLIADDVVVTKPRDGTSVAVGYLALTNTTGDTITITRVTSDAFAAVDMHETIIENDVARMQRLDTVDIAPRSTVEFRQGGKHLMLIGSTGPLHKVTLEFYAGDTPLLAVSTDARD